MTGHDRFRELAAGASDGLLTDAEEHELGLHIRTCPQCRAEMHAFDRDREALVALAPIPVSPRVRAAVLTGGRGRGPTVRWTLLAAAVLVGSLGAAVALTGGRPREALVPPPSDTALPSPVDTPSASPSTSAVARWSARPVTFRNGGTVGLRGTASSLVIADLDSDGDQDLLVGREGTPFQADIILGDGTGVFGGRSTFDVDGADFLEAADLDGDGVVDLFGSSPPQDAIVVLYGLGRLGFGPPTMLPVGASPREVEAADIDGDGRLEIVVADAASDALTILHLSEDRAVDASATLSTAERPTTLVTADFDQDGHADLAAGSRVAPGIAIHWGNADSSFSGSRSMPGAFAPRDMAAADLDADGDPDLVATNDDTGAVSVLLTRPAGPFWVESSLPGAQPATDRPGDVEIADVNGDGRPDIVATNAPGEGLLVWAGLGDGRFGHALAVPVGGTPRAIEVGDLDGDGIADVAVTRDDATIEILQTGD